MNRILRAIVGAVLVLVIAFSGITISQNLGTRLKIDTTERKLYTLSGGTKAILARLNQPIMAKLFYAKTAAMKATDQIRFFNDYYEYVKTLLEEYQGISGGMVKLEIIDPRPFSDEEQEAMQFGLQRIPISQEENFFFGLAVETQFGVAKVIDFFSPDRQRFVEYDISELIDTATTRQKRRIGVLSSLEVMGQEVTPYMERMMRVQNQSPKPPWTIVRQLQEKYDVTRVPTDVNDINDVDVLVIVHPKDLSEQTWFAIDQFILKGGRTIACIDPHCFADQIQTNISQMVIQKQSSDLGPLMVTWGLDMPANTFAGDKSLVLEAALTRDARQEPIMGYLGLTAPDCFNQDDVITADLNYVRMLFPGVLNVTASESSDPNDTNASPITRTPLVTTTAQGNRWSVSSSFELMYPDAEKLMNQFTPGTKPVVMAYMLTGRFPSSFPDGIDVEVDLESDPNDPNAPTTATRHIAGLTEASGDCAVVVLSDVDFLWDQMAYTSTIFGPATVGDNSALLLNAIEEVSGSGDLISIRSRGNYSRPFEVVETIRQEAQDETANQIAVINMQIDDYNQQLQALANSAGDNQQLLGDDIIKQRQKIEMGIYDAQKNLREVQANRSKAIEDLGNDLRRLNTAAVPGVIMIFALVLGIWRSVRKRHYISHASDS